MSKETKRQTTKETLEQFSKTPFAHLCKDIGMYAIDKNKKSCIHKTIGCINCYNNKLFKFFKQLNKPEYQNNLELNWNGINGNIIKNWNSQKRTKIDYLRFCTKGEAIKNYDDILKIEDIAIKNPDVKFWLPTRAFNNEFLKVAIQKILFKYDNLFIFASIDIGTKKDQYNNLKNNNWRFMFFGNNELNDFFGDKITHNCNKTWNHQKNVCTTCKSGCFNKEVNFIYLKQH